MVFCRRGRWPWVTTWLRIRRRKAPTPVSSVRLTIRRAEVIGLSGWVSSILAPARQDAPFCSAGRVGFPRRR